MILGLNGGGIVDLISSPIANFNAFSNLNREKMQPLMPNEKLKEGKEYDLFRVLTFIDDDDVSMKFSLYT